MDVTERTGAHTCCQVQPGLWCWRDLLDTSRANWPTYEAWTADHYWFTELAIPSRSQVFPPLSIQSWALDIDIVAEAFERHYRNLTSKPHASKVTIFSQFTLTINTIQHWDVMSFTNSSVSIRKLKFVDLGYYKSIGSNKSSTWTRTKTTPEKTLIIV